VGGGGIDPNPEGRGGRNFFKGSGGGVWGGAKKFFSRPAGKLGGGGTPKCSFFWRGGTRRCGWEGMGGEGAGLHSGGERTGPGPIGHPAAGPVWGDEKKNPLVCSGGPGARKPGPCGVKKKTWPGAGRRFFGEKSLGVCWGRGERVVVQGRGRFQVRSPMGPAKFGGRGYRGGEWQPPGGGPGRGGSRGRGGPGRKTFMLAPLGGRAQQWACGGARCPWNHFFTDPPQLTPSA